MRLFSKVKTGTPYVAEARNSRQQVLKPAAADTEAQNDAEEQQASFAVVVCSAVLGYYAAPYTLQATRRRS